LAGAERPRLINGRYRVLEELGRGGQGLVLKVADGAQAGCLKVLKTPLASADPDTLERLRWEFVRLARLDHSRLIRVHDLEVVEPGSDVLEPGQVFFTAQYCPGLHPSEYLARLGRRRLPELLWRIASDVASALDHLHGKGVLHGDVKPENLLCTAEGDVKLLDLGLSTMLGRLPGDVVAGTIEHLAPEALAGVTDARSDLYGLGSTLYRLAVGKSPRQLLGGLDGPDRLRAVFEKAPPPLSSLVERLPEGLCALVDSLCAPSPAQRPQSAQVLLEQIARRRRAVSLALSEGQGGLDLLAVAPVGREKLSEEIGRVLGARLALGAEPAGAPALLLLGGEQGSGRRTLLDMTARDLQVAAASGKLSPFRLARGASLGEALAPLLGTRPSLAADDGALLPLIGKLEEASLERGLLVLVEEGERDRGVLERFFTLVRRDPDIRLGRLALAARVTRGSELGQSGVALTREVQPLDGAEVAQVLAQALGVPVGDAVSKAFHSASLGLPERLHALLKAAMIQVGDRRRVAEVNLELLSGSSLCALAVESLVRLTVEARRLGQCVALAEAPIPIPWAAELAGLGVAEAWAVVEELTSAGLIVLSDGRIGASSAAAAEAMMEAAGQGERLPELHRALAQRYRALAEAGDEGARLACIRHLAKAPPSEELPTLAEKAARGAAARSEWRSAAQLLAIALEAGPGEARERLILASAEAKIRAGDYVSGLEELGRLRIDDDSPCILRVLTLRGLALQRQGELQGARRIMEEGLADPRLPSGADPADIAEARAVLGRVRLACGDLEGARSLCPAVGRAPDGRAGIPLLEMGGLAAYSAGSMEDAVEFFEEAALRARAFRDEERLARAEGCLGMVAQARGDLTRASSHYQEAWRLAEARGDVHAGAHFAANLGAVERERGELGAALQPSIAAVRRMVQLGHRAELPLAVYNLGNLLLGLGELSGTAKELSLLAAEAEQGSAPRAGGYLCLLGAELGVRLLREGRPAPRELLRALQRPGSQLAAEASERFMEAGAGREAFYAQITQLECLAAEGQFTQAKECHERLVGMVDALGDPMASHWLSLAVARLTVSSAGSGDEPLELESTLTHLRTATEAFREAGLAEPEWRAELLAAELAHRAGQAEAARGHAQSAARLAQALMERVPESYRSQRERDPDAVALARLERVLGSGSRPPDSGRLSRRQLGAGGDPLLLHRLLEINKRLNQELRLPILLELVLDTVLELIDGERGFILLTNEQEALEVRIARNLDRRSLDPGESSLSRSIAEEAAASGKPVLTVDAAMDERFSSAVSVHGLRIRSVLAVPLRVKGRVVGTIYVDNRLRRGAFGEGDLDLVEDFAEQAAIAIENARMHEALLAQRAEIERLNIELASRLERREAEIAGMRTELRETQVALRARYDYSNIVGQTREMQELFRLLDRITDVDLPVVIYGESGTGKELVARAIHYNGHRKDRPFVSENCGAVPETLLESILFGHARGAFTGADRDRRGLFEVADGGTLFLDEVGEMSQAMQTKLLRVLQEGELRPVGSDRVIRVNVRILAASNRRLEELLAERRMRQDLYYRLNVLSVTLPPLRERRDDIPLLVAHFVEKHSPGRPRRIARPALGRLVSHGWPGNVRELENELQRALALGGDVLGEEDLSPALRGEPAGAEDQGSLSLRGRVERLERQLLVQALERTGGNQTKAAELLGLSRFGLLKKLRRYGMLPKAGGE
jgi:transcriptional regulator with GAF, ATPase, and Fis domain/tetratricopeptide (TPR) repeat protein